MTKSVGAQNQKYLQTLLDLSTLAVAHLLTSAQSGGKKNGHLDERAQSVSVQSREGSIGSLVPMVY